MRWVNLGLKLVPMIIAAIQGVERLAKPAPNLTGAAKQDLAVETVCTMFGITEAALGKDLFEDQAFQQAIRAFIDAYVAMQNVITTRETGIPQGSATPKVAGTTP